ncbi:MAG: uncharacterized protein KVP18_000236 [Porospora cf. gigantea A]|uniref:uncharacterized protein n=1 Tax=Porospora cf. gigantea A TaxID=2853593 RepID=UPI00355A2A71|nr:MAG: hypothetical protein KVP18_000236 [Porospora cf. gigantea A]
MNPGIFRNVAQVRGCVSDDILLKEHDVEGTVLGVLLNDYARNSLAAVAEGANPPKKRRKLGSTLDAYLNSLQPNPPENVTGFRAFSALILVALNRGHHFQFLKYLATQFFQHRHPSLHADAVRAKTMGPLLRIFGLDQWYFFTFCEEFKAMYPTRTHAKINTNK